MPISRFSRRQRFSRLTAAALALAACTLPFAGCQNPAGSRSSGGAQASAIDPRVAELREETRAMVGTARDRVFPALVNIEVVTLRYDGGKEAKDRTGGSGTIISPDGYVLTNAHVTDEGFRFFVILADKQRVPATLVGEDPWTDLAVLKLDTSRLKDSSKPLPFAAFGDSASLLTGDYVLAMGSPFALSRTVTLGIVSNVERVFTSSRDGDADEMLLNWEQRTGLFTTWIQHDALINPGNSGGPLINLDGKIVGINTRGGAGMAFATPSNMAKDVAQALITKGEVPRSSVGASFRHLENTGIQSGVLVDSVDADGPAARAGLKPGDVLTAIDDQPVTARFVEEIPPLLKTLADRPVGSTIRLAYTRPSSISTLNTGTPGVAELTTEKLKRDRGEETALRVWGVTAQRITERAAQVRRLPSTTGVLVSSIRGGSPAATADPALNWGDVITAIDGQPVATIADAIAQYNRIEEMKDKPEWVLVNFQREGKDFLTLVDPTPNDRDPPAPDTPRAWVGVATQPVITTLARKLGSDNHRGFRVTRVYSKTKAADAGLRVGDIITAIDGKKLAPRNLAEAGLFNRAVREMPIDSSATLTVMRDGGSVDLPVSLEATRQTPEEARRERDRDFELVVRDITFFDREDNRWPEDLSGVFVDSADPAGWAGLGGLQGGDVIQRIQDAPIATRADFKKAMDQIRESKPDRVVFVIYRGSRTFFRFVEPDWKPTQHPARTMRED